MKDSTAIDEMKRECHACCTEYPGSDIILESVLANDPILWLGNSTKLFSLASIKLIVLSLLRHLPYYQKNSGQLVRGLKIGRELDYECITSQLVIYTCYENGNARHIAEELRSKGNGNIQTRDAGELSRNDILHDIGPNPQCQVLLLYLNKDLFKDPGGEVSELVELSLKKGIVPVLVSEQDAGEGKCGFSLLYSQTSDELLAHGLFDKLAIPLYNIPDYRKVSLYLLMQRMSDICSTS